MTSNAEILQSAIGGLPRVAERILELPDEQRQKALHAVEQSYIRSVMDLDYDADAARNFVGAIMDALRAEVADQTGNELRATVGRGGFASIERLIKLLTNSDSTID